MKQKTIYFLLIVLIFILIWFIKNKIDTFLYWNFSMLVPLVYTCIKLVQSKRIGTKDNRYQQIVIIFIALLLYLSLSNLGNLENLYRSVIPLFVGGVFIIVILFVIHKR